ncbi:response regulator transcription factor [Ornithinibacillus halophilus]|uniref:DNA-binding response regulator, OmpR family, contains REC and winged-helix (WHTH) domain n=1 Tax=Ornithinibacillus halophilus TaxID=930117 RepID=A0A1M5KX65_9BACI|nr:response regulator transcription factor [Ornithinibacillus halophilus]SHG57099.1 DNA-binding response regulator, OmpR family, contains REC and winged-helix (wHTH) domain [Ornithinibacillus halophilus]
MVGEKKQVNILIVEDDEHINNIIYDVLTKENFACTQAYSGTEGKINLTHQMYELIILDLMLPGLSGEAFMKYLRLELNYETPVIVLSAKEKLDHKLQLFELGADDYVTKPFAVEELLARVHVQLKRNTNTKHALYEYKDLLLDSENISVYIKNHELNLTRQEFKILELLMKNPTRVFTKQDLYELAWNETYLGEDKTLTVHISNIRNKIKHYTDEDYIDTVWGIGFRLST